MKVSKYGIFSGPYFPVFGLNTEHKMGTLAGNRLGRTSSSYILTIILTAWKESNYGVFSGPYFPALGLNADLNTPKFVKM